MCVGDSFTGDAGLGTAGALRHSGSRLRRLHPIGVTVPNHRASDDHPRTTRCDPADSGPGALCRCRATCRGPARQAQHTLHRPMLEGPNSPSRGEPNRAPLGVLSGNSPPQPPSRPAARPEQVRCRDPAVLVAARHSPRHAKRPLAWAFHSPLRGRHLVMARGREVPTTSRPPPRMGTAAEQQYRARDRLAVHHLSGRCRVPGPRRRVTDCPAVGRPPRRCRDRADTATSKVGSNIGSTDGAPAPEVELGPEQP